MFCDFIEGEGEGDDKGEGEGDGEGKGQCDCEGEGAGEGKDVSGRVHCNSAVVECCGIGAINRTLEEVQWFHESCMRDLKVPIIVSPSFVKPEKTK